MSDVTYDFSDRTVAISGAATGIGRATAEAFADAGARVWLLDIDVERSEELVEALTYAGHSAFFQHCDVTDTASANAAFAAIESRGGSLDVLVNNAGGFWDQREVADTTDEEWDRVIALNLTGVFRMSRAAIPLIRQSDTGRIINIGSLAGQTTMYRSSPPYAAAKAGVHALSRVLAFELARDGITVNALAPSTIMTDRVLAVRGPAERKKTAATIPLGRYGDPQDVVTTIMFVASEAAGYLTGETIAVNGGRFMT